MIVRILIVSGLVLSLACGRPAVADDWAFALRQDSGLPTAGPTFGGTWADLDDDGHWDLILSRHADEHAEVYLGRGDLTFAGPVPFNMPPGLLDHHGTAACDHDGDGHLDLVAFNGEETSCRPRGSVLLYENHMSPPGVTVELAPAPGGSPHGLGAVVEVQVGGRVVRRLVRSTANPWNSTVLPVHVGTGEHDGPLPVIVTWPGGQRQQLELPRTGAASRIDRRRATPQRL